MAPAHPSRPPVAALALGTLAFLACWGGGPRAGLAADEIAWSLRRSDIAHYERTTITIRAGKETPGKEQVVTVQGGDLRDAGQYLPVALSTGDLGALFAFRLPGRGQEKTPIKADWHLRQVVRVRVRGQVAVASREDGLVHLVGTYKFKSRGKEAPGDKHDITGGTAEARIAFDPAQGLVRSARVVLAYAQRKLDAKRTDKDKKVTRTYDFALQGVKPFRYEAFQKDVDTAIERGVAHLRTLQKADGSFKPHGKQVLGTTALAVLTLLACDVPREDPAVAKALDWMFRQEARRTYESAVSLMAIDRAYMPAGEMARREGEGKVELVRDLPADRRAWVNETAVTLEKGNASPGSWSYPRSASLLPRSDSSNTQYAVLGLRAASHLGYAVQEKTWMGVIRHFSLHRERKAPKGSVSLVRKGEAVPDERYAHLINPVDVPEAAGFQYATHNPHERARASMTCAGIACLVIARHQLLAMGSKKMTPKLSAEIDAMLLGAWAWLDANWAVDRHAGHPGGGWYYYYLYSLERAGVLERVKRVGGRDWYFEGATQLVLRQGKKKGDWNHPGKDDTPQTCFALLFLKRGTTPLAGPVVTGK
jgi:hypothetical protein